MASEVDLQTTLLPEVQVGNQEQIKGMMCTNDL